MKTRQIAIERAPDRGSPGIVLCTYALAVGGAERQWLYLAEMLLKRGVAVTFVTYEPLVGENAHYLAMLARTGVPALDASILEPAADHQTQEPLSQLAAEFGFGQRDIDSILRLVAAFRLLAPGAVYAQLDEPNIFAGIAARLCGIDRFVMSFRAFNPTYFDWILRPWMLPAYRWLAGWDAVRYTGNGAAAIRSYADWIGIPTDNVHLIPNTIGDFGRQVPSVASIEATRTQLTLEPSAMAIMGVFRLSSEKAPRTFLMVCHRVLSKRTHCAVLIVGDGPMRAELSEFANELGIADRTRFLGERSDVNVLMHLPTLLLHTPIREGMSNVVMEAQAVGLPVVVTAVPGVVDAVHADSALLCPCGDVEALARACERLLSDPDLCERMGAAGKRFAASNFGDESFCSRYLAMAGGSSSA